MKRLASLLLLAGCWTSSPPPPPARPAQQPVKDLVQPVQIVQQEGGCAGDDCDDPCGVAGGVVGGTSAPPPPPPPPPPAPPQNIPPTALEANRIAGSKEILPDDPTKLAIARAGRDKLVASFKLCVDVTGSLTSATTLKSSGFADYDQKILSEMRTGWRYRPYLINGAPAPVCTAVTFIYSQQMPPPPAKP